MWVRGLKLLPSILESLPFGKPREGEGWGLLEAEGVSDWALISTIYAIGTFCPLELFVAC